MGEWSFLSDLFSTLQTYSPMLGRAWLLLMLVFRMLIMGTVASDLFEDEQEEFVCNTLQPGCKQVCYDMAFPISQYRFWVFHIVLIATPSLVFLMYAMHHHNKKNSSPKSKTVSSQDYRKEIHFRRLYLVNVAFRIVAEIGFLMGQWLLYGFTVEAQYPCQRFPCPYTVDCFTSRPAEKTIFLRFYFLVGVIAAVSSIVELLYESVKWFCPSHSPRKPEHFIGNCEEPDNNKQKEGEIVGRYNRKAGNAPSSTKGLKGGSLKSSVSRKGSTGQKQRGYKRVNTRILLV